MKKKLVLFTIVLILVLAFMATATVALADYATYKGRCVNRFTTSAYLTKINDTWFGTYNWYTTTDGYDGNDHTWHYSYILSDSVIMAEGPMNSGGSYYAQDPNRLYPGQVRIRVKNNYEPGQYIYAEGDWELWP